MAGDAYKKVLPGGPIAVPGYKYLELQPGDGPIILQAVSVWTN